jgi:threonylcarbamoyladenosine tRNA methylthiotransferase MtaB
MRIAIQTLGCKVNQSESSSMEGMLRNECHDIVGYDDNPDVCIINTCTVTGKSDYQSRQLIRKAIKTGARVLATGCYAQLKPDELLKIEGLDLIVGNSDKKDIVSYINKLIDNKTDPSFNVNPHSSSLSLQPYYSTRSRAFLKVQDGCNFSCTYCAVPLARGKSRSLRQEDVRIAAERLSSDGFNEIVLTGIHIGCYGLDLYPKSSLLEIVNMLIDSFSHIRFRLSSLEPHEFKDEYLSFINNGNLCAHLHIPLQNGSDKILKAMNRSYTTEFFKKVIDRILLVCPDISIGSDIITGFPGENENDFNDTLKFIEELPLSYFHVFPYSKRSNTPASLFNDQVNDKIKRDRVKTLIDISTNKRLAFINNSLGKILDVIIENKSLNTNIYKGISDNYLRLMIRANDLSKGQRIKVRVISLTRSGLFAEPVNLSNK